MSINLALDNAKKRSKDLFSLPGLRMAIIFYFTVLVFPILLIYLLRESFVTRIAIFIYIFTPIITLAMLYKGEKYLDLRRSLWASGIISLPLSLDPILSLLGIPPLSMSYTSLFLASLLSWSLGRSIKTKSLPIVLSILLLSAEFSTRIFLSISASFVSIFLLRNIIGVISENAIGLRGFDSVRALAELVLSEKGTKIEEALERRSEDGTVSFDLIVLGKNAIVTVDVHPGPFKFGSYDIPFRIVDLLSSSGFDSIFLRRACSHERNLPSVRAVENLLGKISGSLDRVSNCRIGKVVRENSEHFEVTAQRINDTILFTVSGHLLKSFEDIPKYFEDMLSEILGVKVSLIDRHDSLIEGWYVRALPGTELGKELLEVLIRAGEKALSSECYEEVLVGFSKVNPEWRSVGRGGMRALSIAVGGETVTYLSIDCNNVVPELRSLLGFDSIEGTKLILSTTDTHETLSTRLTYNPLGSECEGDQECLGKMADYLRSLVIESIRSMEGSHVQYYRGYLTLPLLGEGNVQSLGYLVNLSSIARNMIALSLLPQLLLLLI